MERTYFGENNKEVLLTRNASHGYKALKFGEELKIGSILNFITDGDTLVFGEKDGLKPDLTKDGITFVCTEFGIAENYSAKVKIIFCDDGQMVVTLLEGLVSITHEGKVITPCTGDIQTDKELGHIHWVDSNTMLGMKNYFGNELHNRFNYDFEYVFTLSSKYRGGATSWSCKCHKDEYIDLSLGFIAEYTKKKESRAEAKRVKDMTSLWMPPMNSDTSYTFDEDDYTYDDDDEEYDDDFSL